MNLEVVSMKAWQAYVLKKTAWLIGIRGEDVFCMTLTEGALDTIKSERVDTEEKTEASGSQPTVTSSDTYSGKAYCIGCSNNTPLVGVVTHTESGRRTVSGVCATCGTKMSRILTT